jgi:hypothetical protein
MIIYSIDNGDFDLLISVAVREMGEEQILSN